MKNILIISVLSLCFLSFASSADIYCALCEEMVGIVEEKLESNATETTIINDMIKLCGDLPFFNQECATIAVNYLPTIIDKLVAKEDPETVCTQVGLCVSKHEIDPVKPHNRHEGASEEGVQSLPRLTKPAFFQAKLN